MRDTQTALANAAAAFDAIRQLLDGACAHQSGTDGLDCYICEAYLRALDGQRAVEAAAFARHQADDPHCTCNDCIADFAAKSEEGAK